MYQHILVPVDASDLSIDNVSKAVALAKALGARITFVHARADYGATDGGALVLAMSPKDYAEQALGDARAVLARGEVEAHTLGVPYQSIAKTSDRPYEVIIDTAEEQGCDLIFMASHGLRGLKGFLLGSQTRKVLDHTNVPVLVSSIESNSSSPEMSSAIAVIKGEHRSLAAVINGFKHALVQARTSGTPVPERLLRAFVVYIRKFTQELHHPKEEAYLFRRLRGMSENVDQIIATLEAQHQEEPAMIDAIESAIHDYSAAPDMTHLGILSAAVEYYAERLWEHMTLEEKGILPNCRTLFNVNDWKEIAHAFQENGDPRFDKDRNEDFSNLFVRIMNLTNTG